jgi:hypothetical protein
MNRAQTGRHIWNTITECCQAETLRRNSISDSREFEKLPLAPSLLS